MAVDVAAILHAFADLSPEGVERVAYDVSEAQGLIWLGTDASAHAHIANELNAAGPTSLGSHNASRQMLHNIERLAAHDELHRHEQRLREGWVFVAGTAEVAGARRSICLPLLSSSLQLRPWGSVARTVAQPVFGDQVQTWNRRLGDNEITPLVADPDRRAALEQSASFGGGGLPEQSKLSPSYLQRFPGLLAWIREVCAAAGLDIQTILTPDAHPLTMRKHDGLVAIVGGGLYAVDDDEEPERRQILRSWAERPGIDQTALATVYRGTDSPPVPDEPVVSPMPLTSAQRELVVRARHEELVVASGAPGTGKSHTVAAIAVDAVLRGSSVLVATQSHHAAEVLADLLDGHPGPIPLLFGNGERRAELIDQLTDRLGHPLSESEVDRRDTEVRRAVDELASARYGVEALLTAEFEAADLVRWAPLIPSLNADAPGIFGADTDLDEVSRLLDAVASEPPDGWFARWRHRKSRRKLDAITKAGDLHLGVQRDALAAARARRASFRLSTMGGVTIDGLWDRLVAANDRVRAAVGERAAAHDRLPASRTNASRRAVSALLAGLRAGRGHRRTLLAEIGPEAMTRTLPLWVGNLSDIEDILPSLPAMFDLVVLDEASQIDQAHAALALLRGRRAVVVGDPRQLRHVSFLADADVADVVQARGIATLADRLDLRRVSAFDAAASSSAVTWLDEHHRSVPHLIEFSAARFYRDRLKLMTRHPSTQQVDAIDVVSVDGVRGDNGVNLVEVSTVMAMLAELRDEGWRSVGIVTPFRAQADAIESAILDKLSLEDISAIGLRVGTVHAFQGGERDLMLVSLGLDRSSPAASRRFVEDPNLFNVMITRARERLIVLSSLGEVDGLVGDYLRWADRGLDAREGGEPTSVWASALASELQRAGLTVAHRYPVGRWEIDLVVGEGAAAIGIECGVHRAGPDPHMERHMALRAAGWRLIDAFPSRWNDAATAAIELTPQLR